MKSSFVDMGALKRTCWVSQVMLFISERYLPTVRWPLWLLNQSVSCVVLRPSPFQLCHVHKQEPYPCWNSRAAEMRNAESRTRIQEREWEVKNEKFVNKKRESEMSLSASVPNRSEASTIIFHQACNMGRLSCQCWTHRW